jgi:hypothetical protein
MDDYLLIARSITRAQCMARVLGQCGIRAAVFRAPAGLTDRGCSYAVRIRSDRFAAAMACLRQARLEPLHIFRRENGEFREVER